MSERRERVRVRGKIRDMFPGSPSEQTSTGKFAICKLHLHPLTMDKALKLHEIVQLVVAYADGKTTVACACVCKLWSDIALDKIWHTIYSPGNLFATSLPSALPLDKQKKVRTISVVIITNTKCVRSGTLKLR